MALRASVARTAARVVRWGLHDVLHRSASQLPGRVALALDPTILGSLAGSITRGSVVVCGTNGKTTTTNVMAQAVEASGATVMCNRAGANMEAGVVAALMERSRADYAVIEADELSTVNILPSLEPGHLILLNLFRDQLDRAGEIDRVQGTIARALALSPGTTLVVCGDDPLSMGVAMEARRSGTEVVAFGIDEPLDIAPDRVPEARFCQVCGTELEYDYRAYAQLGAFRCPRGDFARPHLRWRAHDVVVTGEGVSFTVEGDDLRSPVPIHASFGGVYMVYNLLAAFVGAHLCGVDGATFQRALDDYHPENGRLQRFRVDGREVVLNLAKNPTGFNQNISLMETDERDRCVRIVINDDYNDGKDISWIWDVDFERLATGRTLRVLSGGHRANDLQVRLKYASIPAPVTSSVAEALGEVADLPQEVPLYVLCNYSALWPAKAELDRIGERL